MSQATRILVSLVVGLALGIALAAFAPGAVDPTLTIARPVGTAWLNALQMTVVPLIVSLVVTGVAATAEAARAGRITARAIVLFVVMLIIGGTLSALITPLILMAVPVPGEAAAALRGALGSGVPVEAGAVSLPDLFAAIVPTNVVAAAANGAFLSLIIFTLAFAFAITRIDPARRDQLIALFEGIRDAMLVLINWVLWLAPLGVFALALVVGGSAGTAAVAALLHYIFVVSSIGCLVIVVAFALAWVGGRVSPLRFERAALPAHAVAISTQSSLASLPAMLKGAEAMGVPVATAGVVLPLAVTMFRATQPAMNIAIAIYIAAWFGVPVTAGAIAAALTTAILLSLGSVSLPAQITFFASIAPVCVALGVPVAPLGLLIAVETIPDIFRTFGNVTADLAATATVSARSGRVARDAADGILEEN
ncbi:MAG: cation:dicarboxylase symporter family transporter [Pseudomonadota bacterium]